MLGETFYHQIRQKRTSFTILSITLIIFISGISFTYVIPTLKGFDWIFVFITLISYFLAANVFIGLYRNRILMIYMLSFALSSMGMGWRVWLEWEEYSLVEHMNPIVLIGYPTVVASIIVLIYQLSTKLNAINN
ncbi:hypothetical protein [Ornithinibacillus scapharcae]|uniref:hypothetical protein n=1 Tax=Ornithinibacillus scapharcae TaxID=1147159 RepID=UPI000225B5E8|nr:hypothetical protein [Ornithinibacillus scapharcae]